MTGGIPPHCDREVVNIRDKETVGSLQYMLSRKLPILAVFKVRLTESKGHLKD